jgi:hypothetical protein
MHIGTIKSILEIKPKQQHAPDIKLTAVNKLGRLCKSLLRKTIFIF